MLYEIRTVWSQRVRVGTPVMSRNPGTQVHGAVVPAEPWHNDYNKNLVAVACFAQKRKDKPCNSFCRPSDPHYCQPDILYVNYREGSCPYWTHAVTMCMCTVLAALILLTAHAVEVRR